MSAPKTLFDVTTSIVRRIISQPDLLPYFRSTGLDPEDWPGDWQQTKMLETFIAMAESRGPAYAQHVLALDAVKLSESPNLPRDPEALAGVYHTSLSTHRRTKLRLDLANAQDDQEFEAAISDYSSAKTRGIEVFNFADRLKTILERNEKAVLEGTAIVRIPEWPDLSEMIGGFNPGRLGILAADTGFGKTALALNLARAASKAFPVLFVNMEMNEQDIGERIYIGAVGLEMKTFKTGQLNPQRTGALIESREGERLFYTNGRSLSLSEIYGLTRRVSQKEKIKFVVVDYDQKIALKTSRETPEWKAMQKAVEDLEQMAIKEDLYVLLLAQANEDGDPSSSRRSKFPASTLLYFKRDSQDRTVIEALKNRYGPPKATVAVHYRAHMSQVTEDRRVAASPMGPIR